MNGTPQKPVSLDQYIQFQTAALRQLPRPEEMDSILIDEWLDEQEALKATLKDLLIAPPSKPRLLEISPIELPATEMFRPDEFFRINVEPDAMVTISRINVAFKELFLRHTVEASSPPTSMRCFTPARAVGEAMMLRQFNGGCFSSLAQIRCLLEMQGQGQPGYLLTSGEENIFLLSHGLAVLVWLKEEGWFLMGYPSDKHKAPRGAKVFHSLGHTPQPAPAE